MTANEKIRFVKRIIDEKAAVSPSGPIYVRLFSVTHPENEDATILTRGEQMVIIRMFESEGYVKNVKFDDDNKGCTLEPMSKPKVISVEDKLSYEEAIYLLKVLSENLLNILSTVCGGYFLVSDTRLNAKYVVLCDKIKKIMARKDIAILNLTIPDGMPDHLFVPNELDSWWDDYDGHGKVMRFIGEISSAWARAGQHDFILNGVMLTDIEETDELVAAHKSYKNEMWAIIEKQAEQNQKRAQEQTDAPAKSKSTDSSDEGVLTASGKEWKLSVDPRSGSTRLNKFATRLNPKSREFDILILLIANKDSITTYEELVVGTVTQSTVRNLQFNIRNLKNQLNILPAGNGKNPDIIKNIKNVGYSFKP